VGEEEIIIKNVKESIRSEGESAGEEAGTPIYAPPEDVGENIVTIPVNQTLPELCHSERL